MDYVRQTTEPLFPKVLWNRPVHKSGAGRLLIVGGHRDEFNDVQAIYQLTHASGIGTAHVVVPDSLRKLLGEVADITFAPSSASGSLGKLAAGEILHLATNYDVLMLGANLSNNSETAVLLDSLVSKYDGRLIVFDEALSAFKHQMSKLTSRPNTLIIGTMIEMFAVANASSLPLNIKDGGVINKLEIMNVIAGTGNAVYTLIGRDMIVAAEGKLSLTTAVSSMDFFANASLATLAAFWTQNPSKTFESLTSAAYVLAQARELLHGESDEVLTIQEVEMAIAKTLVHEDW